MTTTEPIEYRLPVELLEISIQNGSEYGWRKNDFLNVIEAARKLQIGIEGGLVQYVFEEGTCELHWLHYFTDRIKKGENWAGYCNRTAKEATDAFNKIIREKNIKKEAIDNFELAKIKSEEGIDIDNHQLFIISFEDKYENTDKVEAPPAETKPNKNKKKPNRNRNRDRDKDRDRNSNQKPNSNPNQG